MPKSDLRLELSEYAPVAERVALFYARYPTGRITTTLLSPLDSSLVVVQARVYRSEGQRVPAATGHAAERQGDGDVNAVACLENTETSAVGRALANLGFTASRQRPSREEMQRVSRARSRLAEGQPQTASPAAHADVPKAVAAHPGMPDSKDQLQTHADLLTDVLRVVGQAERSGLPAARAEVMRYVLLHHPLPDARVVRLERALRHWMAQRGRLRPAQIDSY